MTFKRNRKKIIRISILIAALLLIVVLLSGCVQGMTPIGWSGIVISNGTAFTASKEGRLVAVNLANNSLQLAEPLKLASSGGGLGCGTSTGGSACGGAAPAIAVYGSPALASNIPTGVDDKGNAVLGTIAIIAGYNGKVVAYQSNNLRNVVWEFPKSGNFLSPIVSSVTVSGASVYFGCTDGNLYALDAALGNLKWSAPFATGGEIWASPVVDNNTVYFGSFDKKIYAVDATTGQKKWEFATGANNVATALVQDGIVYVGSLDRNFYALNAADGKEIWRFSASNWFWAKPVFVNGVVYAPALDNMVYALDAKTGNKIREYNAEGQIASWPVVAGNQVIVATKNGNVWGIDTANRNADPKKIATLPKVAETVTAPLAAEGDVVYINGPDNKIYGYNVVTLASLQTISLSSQ